MALLGASVGGCTSSVNRAALYGDLPTLKQEIAERQAQGGLRRGRVEQLAWAVAGREVRSTTGDLGVRRVAQMRPCAGHLGRVLRDRAERLDDAGAEAALVLLETNQLQPAPLVDRYHDASSGAWRAVAARAAVAPEHHRLRRRLIEDPDERVRRNALYAAVESPSPDDLDILLEAGRLDPDPQSRRLALRAVGGLGGERAVLALVDRWARADETERLAIVDAWASPAAYRAGGRDRLVWVVETTHGMPAVTAAAALAQGDGQARSLGVVRLTRALEHGTTEERRLAIQQAPVDDPDARRAIEAAAADENRQVRVMALARLLEVAPTETKYRDALRTLAKGDDPLAFQARAALAAAQDDSIKETLLAELSAPRSFRRLLAAEGLVALGDYAGAATALGDDDPRVRASVACTVLASAEFPLR